MKVIKPINTHNRTLKFKNNLFLQQVSEKKTKV